MKFSLRAAVPAALTAAILVAIAPASAAVAAPVIENTHGLRTIVNVTGQYSWSIDALGVTSSSGTGTIQVEKPAGATVYAAYLMTSNNGQSCSVPTDLQLEGSVIDFDAGVSTSSCSLLDDVTALVAPVVDPAAAGVIDLDILEGPEARAMIEGSALAVVFNDPSVSSATVILSWGTSASSGQLTDFTFPAVTAASLATGDIQLSLGISYSYQVPPFDFAQSTLVELDGVVVSRSAGDRDDCLEADACGNGGLITAGGVGDSLDLPAGAAADAADDELYRVNDFLTEGDTTVQLRTSNSGDDFVFFAGLSIPVTAPVVAAAPAAPAQLPNTGVSTDAGLVGGVAVLVTLLGGALLMSGRLRGVRAAA